MVCHTVCIFDSGKNEGTYCLFAGILYFVSATLNPILYNVMSVRYRKAFRDTLRAALITARCQQPDRDTDRRNRQLFPSRHSDGHIISHSQTVSNRRARSAECLRGWSAVHGQARSSVGGQQTVTVTVTVCHTLSDEAPQHTDQHGHDDDNQMFL